MVSGERGAESDGGASGTASVARPASESTDHQQAPSVPDAALSVLAEGRQVHLALESKHGPHVTPELYSWSAGRLWFAAAAPTLKARLLQSGSRVAAVVSQGGRSVGLEGRVEVFDVRRPWALLRRPGELPAVTAATARYAVRNAPDMVAFAGDTLRGRLGRRLPPARLLFAIQPRSGMFIENDDVISVWGRSSPELPGASNVPAVGEPAVAAVPGPLAAPARWVEDEQRLFISPAVLNLFGVAEQMPIAVVVDRYNAPGPAAKEGTLHRGRATVEDDGWVSLTDVRTVDWEGTNVGPRIKSG